MRYPWKRRTTASDVFDTNDRTRIVLERAHALVEESGGAFIDPTFLMLAIMDENADTSSALLTTCGVSPDALRTSLEKLASVRKTPDELPKRIEFTSRALNGLRRAMADARRRRYEGGGAPEDLLMALLLDEGSAASKAAFRAGASKEKIEDELEMRLEGLERSE